jgi:hypothetical protein
MGGLELWSLAFLAAVFFLTPLPTPAQTKQVGHFRVSETDGFGPLKPPLLELAKESKHRVHHFCVLGYRLEDGDNQAWVHWKEGNQLILWEPQDLILTTSPCSLNP